MENSASLEADSSPYAPESLFAPSSHEEASETNLDSIPAPEPADTAEIGEDAGGLFD